MAPVFWLIFATVGVLGFVWVSSVSVLLQTPVELSGRVAYVVDGDSLYLSGRPQATNQAMGR